MHPRRGGGPPAARRYLNYTGVYKGTSTLGPPSTIYVRAETDQVDTVQSLLAQTANPESPNEAAVSQPSDALTARAAAKSALNGLFLGLGAVALLGGGVGVANIMVIPVLDRRSEIGLRRALGATRTQIRTQFLSEAITLALLGGAAGVLTGALATLIYASGRGAGAGAGPPPPRQGRAGSPPRSRSGASPGCCPRCVPRTSHRPRPCGRS